MKNTMKTFLILLVLVTLLISGCATKEVPEVTGNDGGSSVDSTSPTANAIVDANEVNTQIVDDDLDQTMNDINLDDW